jgi:hypothetical protein
VILAGVVVFLVSFYLVPLIHFENKQGKSFSVIGGETHPVLDPLLFTGIAGAAYAAAKEYPKVMDQVYCYCKCDEPLFYGSPWCRVTALSEGGLEGRPAI